MPRKNEEDLCPRCGDPINGRPALSRCDNQTQVCGGPGGCDEDEARSQYIDNAMFEGGAGFIHFSPVGSVRNASRTILPEWREFAAFAQELEEETGMFTGRDLKSAA